MRRGGIIHDMFISIWVLCIVVCNLRVGVAVVGCLYLL